MREYKRVDPNTFVCCLIEVHYVCNFFLSEYREPTHISSAFAIMGLSCGHCLFLNIFLEMKRGLKREEVQAFLRGKHIVLDSSTLQHHAMHGLRHDLQGLDKLLDALYDSRELPESLLRNCMRSTLLYECLFFWDMGVTDITVVADGQVRIPNGN